MKCKRTHDPIRILEAIFYLLRSGCQWRLLPVCYLHWKSVYNKWRYRKGIKRQIIVDSQGNMLHAHTTCANINDGKVCLDLIAEAKRRYPSLKEMRADKGYRGVGWWSVQSRGLTTAEDLSAIMRENMSRPRI